MANENMGLPAMFGSPIPDVFADEAVMFDMINGTIRISFAVVTPTEPGAPSTVAMASVGRLIMPVNGAQRLSLALYDYLKKCDLDPAALVSEGVTAQ